MLKDKCEAYLHLNGVSFHKLKLASVLIIVDLLP